MVRTKNLKVRTPGQAPDFTAQYSAPFHVECEREGKIYQKLHAREVNQPRCIDWDLVRDLGIEADVVEYLQVLGLESFAKNIAYSAYDNLCYEFLSTMYKAGDKIFARMKNKTYPISKQRMKTVFGFHTGGENKRPDGYNPVLDWYKLSGFYNWNGSGVSNGFITDPALAIVHKFIAYNISGKEQANKVNKTEVYLLTCAKNGIKVCISSFIWDAMTKSQTRANHHAAFGAIITGLAYKVGVLTATQGHQDGYEELHAFDIDYSELFRSYIIADRTTVNPPAKRLCVIRYVNKEVADGRQAPIIPELQGGPSNEGNEDNQGNEDNEAGNEEEEPITPDQEPQQPPVTMSGDGYQQLQFQSEFQSFQTHFDTSIASFREDMHQQFATYREDVNSRFAAQTQFFSDFRQDVFSRFEAQNKQIAALQSQCNACGAFNQPPQPPPHSDQQ